MKIFIGFLHFALYFCSSSAWWFWGRSGDDSLDFKRNRMAEIQCCQLHVNEDFSHNHEPLFLVKGPQGPKLALPEIVEDKGVFKLKKGEELIVACPGRRNEVRGTGAQLAVSKCVTGITLNIADKSVPSTTLDCKNKVFTTLKLTKNECGAFTGEEVELGYEVGGWQKLITICYYRTHGETLYSMHMLYGSSLKGAEKLVRRVNFIKGPKEMFPNFNPEQAYKQTNQRLVLIRLLGLNKANSLLVRTYLSRGHLAPDADFLMGSWQHLTYFYVNTAPQWQSINSGNWLQIETTVRKFAIKKNLDLSIVTGTYGILTLKGRHGRMEKVYLEPYQELLPVPEYFWKLVRDTTLDACMVFVVYNNPFTKSQPLSIFPNICEEKLWKFSNDTFKGQVTCCTYQDFKRIVDYAPDLECKSILYAGES